MWHGTWYWIPCKQLPIDAPPVCKYIISGYTQLPYTDVQDKSKVFQVGRLVSTTLPAAVRFRPVGCGCIAQVYRAYLLLSEGSSADSRRRFLQHCFVLGGSISKPPAVEADEGCKIPPVAVAVKVMRPGVREAMEFGAVHFPAIPCS